MPAGAALGAGRSLLEAACRSAGQHAGRAPRGARRPCAAVAGPAEPRAGPAATRRQLGAPSRRRRPMTRARRRRARKQAAAHVDLRRRSASSLAGGAATAMILMSHAARAATMRARHGAAAAPGRADASRPARSSSSPSPPTPRSRSSGMPAHAGSPWTVELPAGIHQIEIHRAGYKAWLTSLELSARETQTLRVVLEPLTPPRRAPTRRSRSRRRRPVSRPSLDGQPLAEKTPTRRR